jgi:hypothetical protein
MAGSLTILPASAAVVTSLDCSFCLIPAGVVTIWKVATLIGQAALDELVSLCGALLPTAARCAVRRFSTVLENLFGILLASPFAFAETAPAAAAVHPCDHVHRADTDDWSRRAANDLLHPRVTGVCSSDP